MENAGNDEEEFVTQDLENEADRRFDAYSYCSTSAFDVEEDTDVDVICVGSTIRGTPNASTSRVAQRNSVKKRVTFAVDEEENDDIEWISSTKNEPTPRDDSNYASKSDVFNLDDETDDCNYYSQIQPCYANGESNVIDVEREYLTDLDYNRNPTCKHFIDRSSHPPTESSLSTSVVNAIVHAAPSSSLPPPSSPAASLLGDSVQKSEIDDYDARMRACFGLDLDFSVSSLETESSTTELNQNLDGVSSVSTGKREMKCEEFANNNIFDVEDDSGEDDCVITSMEINTCSDVEPYFSCTAFGADKDVKIKGKCSTESINETVDEIFKRMMPLAVPGVLSLFAPDRNCLPRNVRPSKFCYYYFVSSHIVVKEIVKYEFYKFKEQILVAKKRNAPTRCTCLSHPLNQNASKLTLLTNPFSLFHKPNCHFAQNSKNSSIKRKRPRRLSYQVSFHRVPQKREGKDFKEWSDIVIRRKQNASCGHVCSSAKWSRDGPQDNNLITRRPSSYRNEPMDFFFKTESLDNRT